MRPLSAQIPRHWRLVLTCVASASMLCLVGCGKPKDAPTQISATPAKPKEAASQLDQAFVGAEPEVKTVANVASEALKTADYESAVQSLQIIRERGSLSVDQGMAVHNSMVSLEARLITAMAQGDQNAKRAYEQLKKTRRN